MLTFDSLQLTSKRYQIYDIAFMCSFESAQTEKQCICNVQENLEP